MPRSRSRKWVLRFWASINPMPCPPRPTAARASSPEVYSRLEEGLPDSCAWACAFCRPKGDHRTHRASGGPVIRACSFAVSRPGLTARMKLTALHKTSSARHKSASATEVTSCRFRRFCWSGSQSDVAHDAPSRLTPSLRSRSSGFNASPRYIFDRLGNTGIACQWR
jgi:hypothetical protein